MRIALFVTCFDDTLFPEAGRATVEVLERLGHEVVFPAEQTCCGQMHVNTGYRDEARPGSRGASSTSSASTRSSSSPSASCVGWCASSTRTCSASDDLARPLGLRRSTSCRSSSSTGSGSRTSAPRSRTASPTTRPATRCGCPGSATRRCGSSRNVRGLELSSSSDADECCGFGGTFAVKNADTSMAMLADKCAARRGRRRRGLHRGRQLVPDAHRRRALAAALGRPPSHLAEILAATVSESFPAAARRELANAQLRRTSARRRARSARSARTSSASCPTGRSSARPAARSRRTCSRGFPSTSCSSRRPSRRRAATCTGRATPPRRTRSSSRVAREHGADEVVKVKSLTTDEIGLNEALAAEGIHAIETDLAELIVQLAGDWSSHILVPAIHRNRSEIRDLFARTIAPGIASDDPRDLAEAARLYLRERFLAARGRRQRRELRRRRDGDDLRRRVRGQRPHVHDAAAGARHA